jgi:uncharacterized protein YvpB
LFQKIVSSVILILLVESMLATSLRIQPFEADASTPSLIPVPFHYQAKNYYCGPAALEMVLNYYGEDISQYEIACVARTIGSPLFTTYTDELRRAAQFSNISTSMGDELLSNITGYTARQLGYAAFEASGLDLTTLRDVLDQGKPLILLMWQDSTHTYGHYRVATGYNETCVFLDDPWNTHRWGGTYGGPNVAINDDQFLDLWSYSDDWALYVSPWTVNLSAPTYMPPGVPFQIEATVTYPQPLTNAFPLNPYPASSCNISITLPANLSLAEGEAQTKTLGTGLLQAGKSSSANWTLVASSSVNGTVSIMVDGLISGSVGASDNYPAYNYIDRIGARVNFSIDMSVGATIPGDVNHDGKVNLPDLVILAIAYGSKPGDPNWNPNADIDGNGVVGLSDVVILAQHYRQHYP